MIYTIRFYDRADELMNNANIRCRDDAEARHIFDRIKREYTMDLWQGERLIARVPAERPAD